MVGEQWPTATPRKWWRHQVEEEAPAGTSRTRIPLFWGPERSGGRRPLPTPLTVQMKTWGDRRRWHLQLRQGTLAEAKLMGPGTRKLRKPC